MKPGAIHMPLIVVHIDRHASHHDRSQPPAQIHRVLEKGEAGRLDMVDRQLHTVVRITRQLCLA